MLSYLATLLTAWMLVVPAVDAAPGAPVRVHKFHVTYGEMGVEGKVVMCRVRFFDHDLEAAVRAHHDAPDVTLDESPRSDSLFADYFNHHFVVESGGKRLAGRVVSSGREVTGRDEMVWYLLRFDAEETPSELALRNTLLLDQFSDQKNILKVRHFPDEEQQVLYFTHGEETATVTL